MLKPENSVARLVQANLASKNDITDFAKKKTYFDVNKKL